MSGERRCDVIARIHNLALRSCLCALLVWTTDAWGQTRPGPKPPQPDKGAPTDRYGDLLPEGAVARLGTVRMRHFIYSGSGVGSVAFSADGTMLFSAADEGLRVWDVATGKESHWPGNRRS